MVFSSVGGGVMVQASDQSTSTMCMEQNQSVNTSENNMKPQEAIKQNTIIATDTVDVANTSQQSEHSNESSDTFGNKVLRLSRRFLLRSKSMPQDSEEGRSSSHVASAENSGSPVRWTWLYK